MSDETVAAEAFEEDPTAEMRARIAQRAMAVLGLDPSTRAQVWLYVRRVTHPRTFARATGCVFRGLGRAGVRWWFWLKVADKPWLVGEGSSKHDHVIHEKYCQMRRTISATLAGMTAVSWLAVYLVWGRTGIGLLLLATAVGFGLIGRPVASTVLVEKELVPHTPVLDADTIRQVVAGATQGMKPEAWKEIRVLGPGVTWDSDEVWWSVTLEMPGVVPGSAVVAGRPGIMSGLAVGTSQLLLHVDPENEAVVTIAGTRTNPWGKPSRQTPMMKDEVRSVWDAVPVATDARGREVLVNLLFTGWLIGAIPRMGKTNLGRLLALAVALDPSADIAVFDFKGAADWRMFEKMAVRFAKGRAPATFAALYDYLLEVQREVDRRTEIIGDLDIERCPEGQITRALAEDEEFGMRPLFVFIDEAHRAFQHSTWGQKITDLVEDIAKNAPFVGVVLVIMTQKPDSKAVPTRVRDVLGTRSAGKCMTRQSSEAILGTEAYSEGYNAASLPKKAGVFMLYGAEDFAGIFEALTVRVDRCDIAQATMVAQRATAAREKQRRLPTPTGGDATPGDDPVPSLIVCSRQVQGDREWISSEELLRLLNEQPEYGDRPWNHTSLGRTLRHLGYPSFPENTKLRGRRAFDFRGEPVFPEKEKADLRGTGTDGVIVLNRPTKSAPRPRRRAD